MTTLVKLQELYDALHTRPQGGNADELDWHDAITEAWLELAALLRDARELLAYVRQFSNQDTAAAIDDLLARMSS